MLEILLTSDAHALSSTQSCFIFLALLRFMIVTSSIESTFGKFIRHFQYRVQNLFGQVILVSLKYLGRAQDRQLTICPENDTWSKVRIELTVMNEYRMDGSMAEHTIKLQHERCNEPYSKNILLETVPLSP